ncbi:hypothetical protein [Oceanobacillus timonensis]|uniref:hypothetical protein n=1 Tax=Oceanobacillus timonensis TaxID=1926285 RepID=UPI0009BC02E6|nr:hypothetical protein [Oceanobacillus timonensis]
MIIVSAVLLIFGVFMMLIGSKILKKDNEPILFVLGIVCFFCGISMMFIPLLQTLLQDGINI